VASAITDSFPKEEEVSGASDGARGKIYLCEFQLQHSLTWVAPERAASWRRYFFRKSFDPCLSSKRSVTICLSF
jgi:hypothetical protein